MHVGDMGLPELIASPAGVQGHAAGATTAARARARARAFARLVSWLGPWRDKRAVPPDIEMAPFHLSRCGSRGHHLSGLSYHPTDTEPVGSYIFAHGLSFQGPHDPRVDRFARVLAHAGFVVMAPTLHEHTLTMVDPSTGTDLCEAVRGIFERDALPPGRPGLFGVSFGGFPAIVAACDPELGPRFGGCVAFGGYADFPRVLRFTMGIGRDAGCGLPVDQSCLAGVYVNLLEQNAAHLGVHGMQDVATAIRELVAATWGKPEMKPRAVREPIVRAIAARLTPAQAEVFLEAAWMTEGGAARCSDAIGTLDLSGLDPRLHLPRLRCPLYLMHAGDDEVIGAQEMFDLAAAVPEGVPVHTYLTGMYDHGGQSGGHGDGVLAKLAKLPALGYELRVMLGMVDALVKGGSDPLGAGAG